MNDEIDLNPDLTPSSASANHASERRPDVFSVFISDEQLHGEILSLTYSCAPCRRTGAFSVGSGHPPIWRKPFVGCVGSVLLA